MNRSSPLLAAGIALAGCSNLADYAQPAPPVPIAWPAHDAPAGARMPGDWRVMFPDAHLQNLIAAAIEHNRDLRIAVARVEEARALHGVARADRLPTVNVSASRAAALTPGDLSPTGRQVESRRYDAGLAVPAFELDFWGRVRSLADAARANYLATEEAQRAFRLALIADVANAYLSQLELEQRLALARETVQSRAESRHLVAVRRDVGLASDLDYTQADGAWLLAQAEQANLARQRDAAENALRLLVGTDLPPLPAGVALAGQDIVGDLAVGLPAEVLLARPDVRAAEQRLLAAHANVSAARAAFLPKIVLTASLGTASAALSRLFGAGQGAWSFQPVLSMPLFDAGRTGASQDLAEARKVIAVADYERTIQQAFREVADLLSARDKIAQQLADLDATAATQMNRLKLATARYERGMSSYLEVLDAQRDQFSAQQNAVQGRRLLLSTGVQLYKALGGELREPAS